MEPFPLPDIEKINSSPIHYFVEYNLFLKEDEENTGNKHTVLTSYFEQIIDGIVYELYFEESLKKHNKDIIQYLKDLPSIANINSPQEKASITTKIFNKLNDPEHQVRKRLYFIDSVPEIRIIKGKEVH